MYKENNDKINNIKKDLKIVLNKININDNEIDLWVIFFKNNFKLDDNEIKEFINNYVI